MTGYHDHALALELYGECPHCLAGPLHPEGDGRPVPDFDGGTYRRPFDHTRLAGQLRRVYDALVAAPDWMTLAELAKAADAPEASVSARLRDLRKPEFGGFHVEHQRLGTSGLWQYRLLPPGIAGEAR